MTRAEYDRYLDAFNRRDYEDVLSFWADDDFEICFAGYVVRGRENFNAFYTFFHSYVDEHVMVEDYLSDEKHVWIEARVRITARRALTTDAATAAGWERIIPLESNQSVEIPEFIHYTLADGKFKRVLCLVSDAPVFSSAAMPAMSV